MANDADNVVVGANGAVYLAPTGTAMPTDTTTALNAAFIDVGYINDDGVNISVDETITEHTAWQSRNPIRRSRDMQALRFAFIMREFKKANFSLAMGGGTFATVGAVTTFTPPAPGAALAQYACVIEFVDGSSKFRILVPKIERVEVGDIPINKTTISDLSVTLGVIDESGDGGWSVLGPSAFSGWGA